MSFALLGAGAASRGAPETPLSWHLIAPLPDAVGFAGMAAGVMRGRLVAAGGSQWDAPIWAGGKRRFNDRVFWLDNPNATWRAGNVRLPEPVAHFATASTEGAIVIAGGFNTRGPLTSAYVLRPSGDEIEIRELPPLPSPIVYGTGVIARDRFYLFGGLADPADKHASASVWSIALGGEMDWRREPDLPEGGRFLMTAAECEDQIYLFGGMAFDSAGKPQPQRSSYRLGTQRWEKLSPLPEPRVGAANPSAVLSDGRVLVAGGYAELFGGAPREHPGFASQTLIYDPATDRWAAGPGLPTSPAGNRDLPGDAGPLPMIGAPGVQWGNWFVVVSGEVRVSTRTPSVVALRLRD